MSRAYDRVHHVYITYESPTYTHTKLLPTRKKSPNVVINSLKRAFICRQADSVTCEGVQSPRVGERDILSACRETLHFKVDIPFPEPSGTRKN